MARADPFLKTDAQAIRLAKTLMRTARFGALATIDADGAPLATRVAVATDTDGAPLILVSTLSAHTGALQAEPRCALLVGEPGKGDPLAHPRLTLKARAERLQPGTAGHAHARRRYLNRHPKAKLYEGFPDFSFFRLEPQDGLLNGGFARAYRLTRGELLAPAQIAAALAETEQQALDHMNAEHADAVEAYATALAAGTAGQWRLVGIDPEGIDLARGDEVRRVFFEAPLGEPSQLRPVLMAMARKARGG